MRGWISFALSTLQEPAAPTALHSGQTQVGWPPRGKPHGVFHRTVASLEQAKGVQEHNQNAQRRQPAQQLPPQAEQLRLFDTQGLLHGLAA